MLESESQSNHNMLRQIGNRGDELIWIDMARLAGGGTSLEST